MSREIKTAEENKVYAFLYCDCIYESGYTTMSLHKTQRGAEIAMEFHKAKAKKEYENIHSEFEPTFDFGEMEGWIIQEMEIVD